MFTVTVGELLGSIAMLKRLGSQSMSARMAFKIGRLLKKADDYLTVAYNSRDAIIDKYGARDSSGKLVVNENGVCSISPGHIADAEREMRELQAEVIEFDMDKLPMEIFDCGEFTPLELSTIECFIEV